MNKKLLALILLILIPISVQARDISELKFIKLASYEEINSYCLQPEEYDPVSGCYLATEEIYLRNDLPLERFIFVFWHEIGHFFMKGITDEQFGEVFNPTPQKLGATIISEVAADTFALWIMGGKVPKVQKEFFIQAILK